MDYIVNGNTKMIIESEGKIHTALLHKENVNAYCKALRKLKAVKGGRK